MNAAPDAGPVSTQNSRCCVFAHYDRDNEVDPYVLYYLEELIACCREVVFVTTSQLSADTVAQLQGMGLQVLQRENRGYDFMSYKTGIQRLDLSQFEELLLCNDSVYGPFFPLSSLMERLHEIESDIVGLTDSLEVAPHLQSYFLLFRRPVLISEALQDFWRDVETLDSKGDIIRRYEVGLSEFFRARNYSLGALVSARSGDFARRFSRSLAYYTRTIVRRAFEIEFWKLAFDSLRGGRSAGVNQTHVDWKFLLLERQFPFIKIELLRDNPKSLKDVDEWPQVLQQISNYPTDIIAKHLSRVAGGDRTAP